METKKFRYDLESEIEMIGSNDEVFAPAKILIGYCGDNRNWSSITEDAFANAPIKNIPVVANFISDKNDFGSHDVKIVQNKDGIDIYAATVPFGLVPESAKQWFTDEMVDGEMKRCFWTECLLWKRQYGFEKIAESKRVNHSMEIEASEYTFRDDGYTQIDKMRFEALCLLGSDVEPCFENSRLELGYSLDAEISQMMEQYKQYCLQKEVTNEMENENKFTNENETVTEPEVTPAVAEPETTNEGEFTNTESETENTEPATPEATNDDEPVNTDGQSEPETDPVDYELQYNELKSQYDALNSEVETLRQFKADVEAKERAAQEEAVFAKFEKLNELEEYKKLRENSAEYTIEALEEKCYAIAGKNGINLFSAENQETEPVTKFSVVPEENTKKESRYGDLFERYGNN